MSKKDKNNSESMAVDEEVLDQLMSNLYQRDPALEITDPIEANRREASRVKYRSIQSPEKFRERLRDGYQALVHHLNQQRQSEE